MTQDDPNPLRRIQTKTVPATSVEIGSTLRAARMQIGRSLDVASHQTRIPRKYLEALETNRFEEFAAMAYLRGFLKSYCDYLEVEFEPLWEGIVPQPPPAPPPPPAENFPAAEAGPSQGIWLLRISLPAAILIGFLIWKLPGKAPVESSPKPPTAPRALRPLTTPAEPELEIFFLAETWLSLKVDGESRFKGRVPKGSRQKWKGRREFILETPGPNALSLTLSGKKVLLPPPDASGAFRIGADLSQRAP